MVACAITPCQIFYDAPAIALLLKIWHDGEILQLTEAVALIGDDRDGNGVARFGQHIQRAPLEIAIQHILLFVSQQQKIKPAFFILGDLFNFHHICPFWYSSV